MDYEKFIHKAEQEDLTDLIEFLDLEEAKKNPLLYFEKHELLQKVLENVYYIKAKDFGLLKIHEHIYINDAESPPL